MRNAGLEEVQAGIKIAGRNTKLNMLFSPLAKPAIPAKQAFPGKKNMPKKSLTF